MIDAADDPARRTAIGSAVVATLLLAGPDGQPVVETADVTALKAIVPDQLFAVRRPVSHKGMKNYISRVAVPTELDGARAVWCESFNELSHLRDLLLRRRPRQVATQPFRLEWRFPSGVRSHVPDFMIKVRDDRVTLVDVTTSSKIRDPRLRAILQLTRTTADIAGWDYEVRSELPAQYVRNLNFIHASGHDTIQDRPSAVRLLRQAAGPVDVQRASELLGGGAQGYMRLWDLFAHGFVHISMDVPIEVDTRITFEQPTGGAAWLNAL
ncbi:MAG TPA: hypothetical protein PKA99_15340 [Dermatophilaceae bacterium]|nr:hypothetical protein [Dermatophilaceae bacterium]